MITGEWIFEKRMEILKSIIGSSELEIANRLAEAINAENKDTARLDWCEEHTNGTPTVRQAIDEAIKEEKGE